MTPRWTEDDIADLSGTTAVVTGASAGLGLQTATVLAGKGATVVLACRDLDKASTAATEIGERHPQSTTHTVELDLARQASVRAAAAEIKERFERVDLLINNAGVMNPPYAETEDGFELTFATNHLGPFALTGLLIDHLNRSPAARVVTVSSVVHARGAIDFDDLQAQQGYDRDKAYAQSKLANLLFTYELDRRLRDAQVGTRALAAHPGVVPTDLFKHDSWLGRAILSPWLKPLNFWLAQDVRMGALPTLRAATDQAAGGSEYYGPKGPGFTGYPVVVTPAERANDPAAQARLWEVSERLTGVSSDPLA